MVKDWHDACWLLLFLKHFFFAESGVRSDKLRRMEKQDRIVNIVYAALFSYPYSNHSREVSRILRCPAHEDIYLRRNPCPCQVRESITARQVAWNPRRLSADAID